MRPSPTASSGSDELLPLTKRSGERSICGLPNGHTATSAAKVDLGTVPRRRRRLISCLT